MIPEMYAALRNFAGLNRKFGPACFPFLTAAREGGSSGLRNWNPLLSGLGPALAR